MNKYIFLLVLWFGVALHVQSKTLTKTFDVPAEMRFAEMELIIDQEARELIQGRVDEFVQTGHYNVCVLRAKLFFPLIEQILTSQHTPTDVKYLSLPSSLIRPNFQTPDGSAGLWQMSDSLAQHIGLVVNNEIDERMNIITSSESIAKHLNEKNYLLRNWVYTLMSYRMDLVDAVNQMDKSLIGANQIYITGKTPKAILNLLAYVIAYKDKIEATPSPKLEFLAYNDTKGKSLEQIANFTHLPYEQVKNFNPWLLMDKVPTYKDFPVLLPVSTQYKSDLKRLIEGKNANSEATILFDTTKYPMLAGKTLKPYRDKNYTFVMANGLKAMIAGEGDRTADMADIADISPEKFRQLNEMTDFDDVKAGQVYYLEKKNRKSEVKEHIMEAGESFWDVSQRYGVRISTLITNNRLSERDTAKVGRVVWLKEKRPENFPVEYKQLAQNPIYVQPDNEILNVATNNIPKQVEKIKDTLPTANSTTPNSDTDSTYTVKAGETIVEVFKKTNVPFDELVALNDLKTPNVYEGQVLRLKPSAVVKGNVANIPTNTDPSFVPPTAEEIATLQMTVAKSDSTKPNAEEHTVAKGETLSGIAEKYSLVTNDLKKWNGLDAKASIRVGQKLKLKAPAANAMMTSTDLTSKVDSAEVVHTVAAKESLWGIAKKYGVTQTDIAKINQLDEKTPIIKTGQKLTIKRRTAPRNAIEQSPVINQLSVNNQQQATNNQQQANNNQQQVVNNQKAISNNQQQPVAEYNSPKNDLPYVVNPPASENDIVEVNPSVDYFGNLKKRHYIDNEDLSKWNGIPIVEVINGTIPAERRTLVVSQKGYNMSLLSGNTVVYPKIVENNTPQNTNYQQINSYQPPTSNNNPQGVISQTSNNQQENTNTPTQKIPVNAFADNFFAIKDKYRLTDEDIARLNPMIPIDVIKGGSIPDHITELVVAGSGNGTSTATDSQVPDYGTGSSGGTNPVEMNSNLIASIPYDQAIIHQVSYKETIYGIAKMYNANPDSIGIWNNLKDGKIDNGQQLIVGRKPMQASSENSITLTTAPTNESPNFHILKKGETLYGVAKLYGKEKDMTELMDLNPKFAKNLILKDGDTIFLQKPLEKGTLSATSISQDEGYYTVQQGDDMYKICEKFKIKPSDLKIWNKIGAGVGVTKPIPVGTKLVVDADLADILKNRTGELPTASLNDEPIYHFVKKGETLSGIAKKYNTATDDLKAINNKSDDGLKEGEKLLVGKIYYHTVSKGETLSAIAQRYKISNDQLKAFNNKKDDMVKEGEKLIVGK
jgi:membrane-bound lytic murein transglycosylase D